ncbi:protein FAR1-RELATED SEQUENCE 5-like [Panicum miliaceum]|uniref:Protein FAR1-RELATED SEQUENCE n=1 Tax=Panicum miliaceum TaxID=4540 RepID=A0A3L6RXD4_PANMI|nr:protein FAR1-RELATED SEQUENCE 5-like [Panicum miliaceum]
MDIAIANCWPGVAHLWCRWHILKTGREGIGPLFNFGTPLYNQFHKIINDMLTIDEFEKAWHQLLVDFELTENEFMERT